MKKYEFYRNEYNAFYNLQDAFSALSKVSQSFIDVLAYIERLRLDNIKSSIDSGNTSAIISIHDIFALYPHAGDQKKALRLIYKTLCLLTQGELNQPQIKFDEDKHSAELSYTTFSGKNTFIFRCTEYNTCQTYATWICFANNDTALSSIKNYNDQQNRQSWPSCWDISSSTTAAECGDTRSV